MTLHIQMIIECNNKVVALLHQQDFPNAVVSSAMAMRLLQELQTSSLTTKKVASAGGTFNCATPDWVDQCMLLYPDNTKTDDDDNNNNEDNVMFVYNQGIMIPPFIDNATMESAIESGLVSAILIFNSALVHQLYAQQHQDEASITERLLVKSKRLYELALGIFNDGDTNVLFQLAVINNVAVIEFQTGNTAQSKQYFEDVLMPTLLILLVDGDEGCCCKSKLRQLRGFLHNLAFFQAKRVASAA